MVPKSYRPLIAAYVLSIVGVIAVAAVAFWLSERQSQAAAWVSHTQRALAQLEEIQRDLLDAESSGRAFLLTANPAMRARSDRSLRAGMRELEAFSKHTADDRQQQSFIQQLQHYTAERFGLLSEVMLVRQQRGIEAAIAIASSGAGSAAMDTISDVLDSMKARERDRLQLRIEQHRDTVHNSKLAVILMIASGIGILSLLVWLNVRELQRRLEAEGLAAAQARRDALTGLANRLALNERLHAAISAAKRYQHSVALLYLDLDGFKRVNDTLGHAAGDELLRIVADRLQSCVRGEDIVARLGGDEFVVCLPVVQQVDGVAWVAEKIIGALKTSFTVFGAEASVGASVGISMYPAHAASADELLTLADEALYRAKAAGKGTYRFAAGTPQLRSVERPQSA